MILNTDDIGDARVAANDYRWQRGDRVQWQDATGCWRQGEVASRELDWPQATVVDWKRHEIVCVMYRDLHRVYPRGIDE